MNLITALRSRLSDEDIAALSVERLNLLLEEHTLVGFEAALRSIYGAEVARAVVASLVGTADRPNSQLAPAVTRQHVSKVACRVRRGLGLPVETYRNARPKGRIN